MPLEHHFLLDRKKSFILIAILATFICISTLYQYQRQNHEGIRFAIASNSMTKSAEDGGGIVNSDLEFQKYHFKLKNRDRFRRMHKAGKGNVLGELQLLVVPQVSCPTMVRVGALGDGGKWVCNPWRAPSGCVIYSFGIDGDVRFEEELHAMTDYRCKSYSVDTVAQPDRLFKSFNGTFIQASIAGHSNYVENGRISIMDLMRRFNHTRVDILKMDIESWEFESLGEFFKEANTSISESQSSVCQLLVEFHFTNERLATWTEMLEQLQRLGFRMFSKEANPYGHHCYEYSFIHLSCFVMYGLNKEAVFDT